MEIDNCYIMQRCYVTLCLSMIERDLIVDRVTTGTMNYSELHQTVTLYSLSLSLSLSLS